MSGSDLSGKHSRRSTPVPVGTLDATEERPIRVLHVEDDPDFADLVSTGLERERDNVDVVSTERAEDALERLAGGTFDCVVSDYEMPGPNGLELLEEVRDAHGDLPFILFTGKGSEEIASEAISAGVTDYLQKQGGLDQFALLAKRIENAVTKRRTEEALRRREASHREAQRIAGLGHWEFDVATGALFWSAEVYRIFGVDPAAFSPTYDAFLDRVHPDDRERVERAVDAALAGDASYGVRHRIRAADGEVRTVHERGEVVHEDGESTLMRGTVLDVTDQARAEARLSDHRRTIEALHAAAADLVRCAGVDAVFDQAVDAAETVLEFDCCAFFLVVDGELTPAAGSSDFERTDVDPGDLRGGIARRTAETGQTTVVDDAASEDVPATVPGGYTSALSVPVGDRGVFLAVGREPESFSEVDARLAELLVIHVSTALERIEGERDLRAFRRAVEAAGHSIYLTDLDGTITYVNPAFEATTGYAAEDAVGRNPNILKSGEHDDAFYRDLWETITAGDVWEGKVVNRTRDGERYVVDQTVAPVEGVDGEIEGYVAVNTAVTDQPTGVGRPDEPS